jgi:truncated hemoglobin YjbI
MTPERWRRVGELFHESFDIAPAERTAWINSVLAADPVVGQDMNMIAAHQGRGVTVEAFNSVVEDLAATLDKLKVPEKERRRLLGLLAPLKAAIVQR